MTHSEIAQHRLVSHKLDEVSHNSPQEILRHFGAMQAQDYAMAKWAIGSRCHATEKEIEEAVNSGKIIKTHILRPTWHFVAADDIYWMLDLSGPLVQKLIYPAAEKYGLDQKKLDSYNSDLQKILSGGNHLTREEIMQELHIKKTSSLDYMTAVIMMNAELAGLVCNGKMKGKQHTYALLEERVSKPKTTLTQEEGLAKLMQIYFESRGPATLSDFSKWSGFSITICKPVINAIKLHVECITIDNQQYWLGKDTGNKNNFKEKVHFIAGFDEFLISYKSREASILLEDQSKVFTKNGIFKPVILENGKVIGTWKRTIKKDHAKIETQFFNETETSKKAILFKEIKRFENYLETKIVIE
ncbi:winged helix DNA-binding domain-containing protein [Flavobacterium sp. ACN6]|uniref:winged helix DNA-binding domain-containing protein n=1 Tax=Flavobacterium sp. ACN6 TaxID=1920426 RepID=UPI000BB32DDD|nr:winged helix DNA-binding domain-containing protein [Flavobacterium sp. ACN6]PBJ12842.1 hypothetical protein BSF42_20230 [Flavobacterium sp. ACN6]